MRIAFVISSLGGGGAERVAVNLANGLKESGHTVLILTYREDESDIFPLDAGILQGRLNFKTTGLGKIRNIKKALCDFRPDRVIAFIHKTNVRTVFAGLGQSWKTIVTEHNDPRIQKIEPKWRLMRAVAYMLAWKVISVSRGVDRYFQFISRNKRFVLPNAFPVHAYKKPAKVQFRKIIAVGRLVEQKGFDLLIEAFSRLPSELTNWSLEIWGEGDQGPPLRKLVEEKGLCDRVLLKGWARDPIQKMSEADFLVCSSRYEGFGNILVEAMSTGIPVVSFDCPAGPRDIIQQGKNGFLVPNGDVRELTHKMEFLMQNSKVRESMGMNALEMAQQYSLGSITERWINLLEIAE